MQLKKAIVTLAIGKYYLERWNRFCFPTWQAYAKRHGYDIICIENPIDSSGRHNNDYCWHKCLILGQEKLSGYERVVWLDADIVINPNSPCVTAGVPEDKIGAVEMFSGPLGESFPSESGSSEFLIDRASKFWGWPFRTAGQFYLSAGLSGSFDKMVQTGVLVLSPRYHRSILERAYYDYENTKWSHHEMCGLSYEILKAGCVYWLDHRFNRLWVECMQRDYPFLLPHLYSNNFSGKVMRRLAGFYYLFKMGRVTSYCLSTAFINNYFLHFAGLPQYISRLNTKVNTWNRLRSKLENY